MANEKEPIREDDDVIIVNRSDFKGIGRASVIASEPPLEESEEIVEKSSSRRSSTAKGWLKEIVIALCLAILIMQFIKPTIVKQRSMEPNFHSNDYVLVNKQAYKVFGGTPALGDVIVFHSELQTEEGADKLLIKRVIGLPGDVLSITDGKVFVNGEMLDDSYTKDAYTSGSIEDYVVPEDHVFCLGDNRAISIDSRSMNVGAVAYEDILGKVVFRLFPFSKFGKIDNPYE